MKISTLSCIKWTLLWIKTRPAQQLLIRPITMPPPPSAKSKICSKNLGAILGHRSTDKHDFHISTLWRWLNANNFINRNKRVIWDLQDADYVHYVLLECDTKYSSKSWLKFQRTLLLLSSENRKMMTNRARSPDVHCYQTAWCHVPKHRILYNWPQKNSHTFHLYQRLFMQKNKGLGKYENLESFTFINLVFSKFPMLNIPMNYGQTPIQHPLL